MIEIFGPGNYDVNKFPEIIDTDIGTYCVVRKFEYAPSFE